MRHRTVFQAINIRKTNTKEGRVAGENSVDGAAAFSRCVPRHGK